MKGTSRWRHFVMASAALTLIGVGTSLVYLIFVYPIIPRILGPMLASVYEAFGRIGLGVIGLILLSVLARSLRLYVKLLVHGLDRPRALTSNSFLTAADKIMPPAKVIFTTYNKFIAFLKKRNIADVDQKTISSFYRLMAEAYTRPYESIARPLWPDPFYWLVWTKQHDLGWKGDIFNSLAIFGVTDRLVSEVLVTSNTASDYEQLANDLQDSFGVLIEFDPRIYDFLLLVVLWYVRQYGMRQIIEERKKFRSLWALFEAVCVKFPEKRELVACLFNSFEHIDQRVKEQFENESLIDSAA